MVRTFAKPQAAREIEARARCCGVRVAVIVEARRYCAASQREAGTTHTIARTPVGWACSCQGYYHTGCCKHLGAVQRRAAREGWPFGVIGLARHQAGAKLAQHGVIEARIGQLQAEQVFPVDPAAHRVGGLPVGQPFHELHERRQRQARRRCRRLAARGEERGEIPIGEEAPEHIVQAQIAIAARERRPGHLRRVVRHELGHLLLERHGKPPFLGGISHGARHAAYHSVSQRRPSWAKAALATQERFSATRALPR